MNIGKQLFLAHFLCVEDFKLFLTDTSLLRCIMVFCVLKTLNSFL